MVARRQAHRVRALDRRGARRDSCRRRGRRTLARSVTAAGPLPASALQSRRHVDRRRALDRRSADLAAVVGGSRHLSASPSTGGAAARLTDKGRDPHFVGNERPHLLHRRRAAREGKRAGARARQRGCERQGPARARTLALCEQHGGLAERRVAGVPRELPRLRRADAAGRHRSTCRCRRKRLPQRRASDIGGDYINWIDGDTLTWTLGPALYRAEMAELFASGSKRGGRPHEHGERIANLSITRPADKPRGVVALTGARIVTMNDARQVIDERHDRRARQPHRRRRRERAPCRFPADAQRLDLAGRTVMPGHHRHSRARTAGRERHRAAAELVGARASRARRHDGARPVEQGDRDLRCRRVSARRRDPRAAHLLDRRRRLRRALRRLREHRQARGRAQSHPAPQGAGRDLDQELQPAAARAASDGRRPPRAKPA